MLTDFEELDRFKSIELSQMDSIKLMNRIDTKYLADLTTLRKILNEAADSGYLAFEISGRKVSEYRSLYYDTPSLQMYLDHHNRRLVRQKLRTRYYESTGSTFIELKTKNNHGRTRKKRMEIAPENYRMTAIDDDVISPWLDEKMTYKRLEMTPSLETVFSRITLVNPEITERSTIDFNLRFNNMRRQTSADMGNIAVIEVKQDGNLPSAFRDLLLKHMVKPVRISKYCIGTVLTDDKAKSCRFKKKIRLIDKMNSTI